MDYEKKIREYMVSSKVDQLYKSMLNNLFPELKESDDERIRKEILQFLKENPEAGKLQTKQYSMWIDWLEKQGEQNKQEKDTILCHLWHNESEKCLDKKAYILFHSTYDNTWNVFTAGTINWNVVDKWAYLSDIFNIVNKDSKQAEQKPAEWSDKDERALNDAIVALSMYANGDIPPILPSILLEDVEKLKSLKDRVLPQPKREWSEGDSVRLQRIIDFLWKNRKGDTDTIYQQEQDIDWLKSLRPQKQCCNDIPSREYILNVWELGNYWKELTNGVCSTEYGTQLEYIQKYWKEGGYYDKISACPQKQWKPSKEQLQALRWVCNRTFIAQEPQKESALEDLYEQLKAL